MVVEYICKLEVWRYKLTRKILHQDRVINCPYFHLFLRFTSHKVKLHSLSFIFFSLVISFKGCQFSWIVSFKGWKPWFTTLSLKAMWGERRARTLFGNHRMVQIVKNWSQFQTDNSHCFYWSCSLSRLPGSVVLKF